MQTQEPYITLAQFLKRESIISTGGEAKTFLLEHSVQVNGEEERRRGRKLRLHDRVTVDNTEYVITSI